MAGDDMEHSPGPNEADWSPTSLTSAVAAELYAALFEHSADGIILSLLDGAILRANPAACRILRTTEAELQRMGRAGLVVVEPALLEKLAERLAQGWAVGELQFRRGDGVVIPVAVTSGLLPGPAGRRFAYNLFREVTAERQAEAALRASEARYRALADSITDSVFALDAQLRYTFWNRASERNSGIAARDALGRSLRELYPDAAGAEAEAVYREVLRTGVARSFSTSYPIAGQPQRWDVDCYPAGDGLTVFCRDVTARHELQERLTRVERLASLGTLAAGMAHELNNPLTAVVGNLGFALEQVRTLATEAPASAPLGDAAAALQDAADGAKHIKEIVGALKRIAPTSPVQAAHADLRRSLELALEVARPALTPCAGVRLEVPDLPAVAVPEPDLVQLWASLLVNAGQATGARPNLVRVTAALLTPTVVQVRLEDGGEGMGPAVLARAFEPFFSTRGVGGGKGLGLAVCRGLVMAAGGEIALASQPGQGTTVSVQLPVARTPPD